MDVSISIPNLYMGKEELIGTLLLIEPPTSWIRQDGALARKDLKSFMTSGRWEWKVIPRRLPRKLRKINLQMERASKDIRKGTDCRSVRSKRLVKTVLGFLAVWTGEKTAELSLRHSGLCGLD